MAVGGPYFSGLVAYDRAQLMGSSWVSQCGLGDVIALIKADFLSIPPLSLLAVE